MTPIDELATCWPGERIADWDIVDEGSWESFPASDPPCYARPRPSPPRTRSVRARRAARRRRLR